MGTRPDGSGGYGDAVLDHTIDMKLKAKALNGGSVELAVLVTDIMSEHPERFCDEGFRHRVYRDWVAGRCKQRMRRTPDQDTFDDLGVIPQRCKAFLSKRAAWFFNRRTRRYDYLIKATRDAWREAIGIRMDMTEAIAEATDPYREGLDLLEAEGCDTVEAWIRQEQKRTTTK